jgi:pimeloyl-ACP methyl ester carboxylesterase
MVITEGVALNNQVRLHYLDGHADGPTGLSIVIVPGLAESAEDYAELMRRLAPRRCVTISLRGRGRSDTPASGYTLDDHADDVLAVVRHLGLPRLVFVAFSRGVPYAIRCAARHPERVAGLALGDYAAIHTRLPQEWVPWFLAGSWRGTAVVERVPEAVVHAIQRESVQVPLWDQLRSIDCPVLVVGGRKDGVLTPEDVVQYRHAGVADLRIAWLEDAGHDLLAPDETALVDMPEGFLRDLEQPPAPPPGRYRGSR